MLCVAARDKQHIGEGAAGNALVVSTQSAFYYKLESFPAFESKAPSYT
jgi:hypothetical protein